MTRNSLSNKWKPCKTTNDLNAMKWSVCIKCVLFFFCQKEQIDKLYTEIQKGKLGLEALSKQIHNYRNLMRSLRREREDKYKLDQCNKVENWLAKNEIAKYEKKKKSILLAFLTHLAKDHVNLCHPWSKTTFSLKPLS